MGGLAKIGHAEVSDAYEQARVLVILKSVGFRKFYVFGSPGGRRTPAS